MKKKQVSGGIILSFLTQFIATVVGLLYTPIMIRVLGQNEYGLYQLVQSVVNYLNLMNFGFSGAYIRYFYLAKAEGDQEKIANVNGMFMKVFLFIAFLCIVGGIVILLNIRMLGSRLTEADYVTARRLLIILVLNLAISFPNTLYTCFLTANERFIYHRAVGIIINILLPVFTLPLLWMGAGSVGVVSVTLLLTVLRLITNIWYCKRKLGMRINIRYMDKTVFSDLLGYTFFIFLSDLVDQLNSNVDKFLLGRMIGTVSVAIYSVGNNLKHYYTMVSWLIPEMYKPEVNRLAIEEKNDLKLTYLFTKIGRFNNWICLLVLTGFILFGKAFISLWVGPGYENSYYVCVILMLAGYIPSVQTLGVDIQNAKNMHRARSVAYFGIACINVVCSIFLIRLWGEIGTALGTLAAIIIGSGFFMNYYYYKYIKLDIFYFWKRILKWTIPAGLLCLVSWFALSGLTIDTWPKMIGLALGYSLLYGVLLWLLGLTKEEKERITAFIRKKKEKLLPKRGIN